MAFLTPGRWLARCGETMRFRSHSTRRPPSGNFPALDAQFGQTTTFFIRHIFLCDSEATSLATFWSYRLWAEAVRRGRTKFIPMFEWAIWWKFHSPKHEIWYNLNIFTQGTLFCESECHAPSHLLVESTLGEAQGGQPMTPAGHLVKIQHAGLLDAIDRNRTEHNRTEQY